MAQVTQPANQSLVNLEKPAPTTSEAPATTDEPQKSSTLIYLGDKRTADQQGAAPSSTVEVKPTDIAELSAQERKALRKQRFGSLDATQKATATTLDALKQLEENKKKMLERAERFGIVTKEMTQ